MKYRTADYIRSFVYALSCESGCAGLGVACRERVPNSDEWEVCFYSREGRSSVLCDFIVLAKGICNLVPTFTMYRGQFNSATYGENFVEAIIIW